MARVREGENPTSDSTAGAPSETTTAETVAAAPVQAKGPAKPAQRVKKAANAAPKRVVPTTIRKDTDVRDLPAGKEGSVTFSPSGVPIVEQGEVEVETNLTGFNEKAAKLKFLEEPVTIIISESTEKNPESHVFCKVNGRGPGPGGTPWIPRGVEVTVPRKFVEVLAKARPVRVSSQEGLNSQGERFIDNKKTSSERYPFQVTHDPNPNGIEWLRAIRARRAG
jgi:hypothetical protein